MSFYSLSEHRASTKSFHIRLFLAILDSSLQLFPSLLISSSVFLFHVITGRPLVLRPIGVQLSACLVMSSAGFLNVCPIQFHLRFFISFSIGVWLVRFHKSLFVMVFGQKIFKIFRRHLFMKTCTLFWVFFRDRPCFAGIQ